METFKNLMESEITKDDLVPGFTFFVLSKDGRSVSRYKIIGEKESRQRYLAGKKLKNSVPNLNCGKCGFKSCNEVIRAILDKKAKKEQCPFIKQKVVDKKI